MRSLGEELRVCKGLLVIGNFREQALCEPGVYRGYKTVQRENRVSYSTNGA